MFTIPKIRRQACIEAWAAPTGYRHLAMRRAKSLKGLTHSWSALLEGRRGAYTPKNACLNLKGLLAIASSPFCYLALSLRVRTFAYVP
jgi:hypothetical protein